MVYLFQARFRWRELNRKGVSNSFEGGGGSLSNLIILYCIAGSRKTGRNRPSYCFLPPVLDQGNDCLTWRFKEKKIICVVQGFSTSFFTCGNLEICELQNS